MDNQPKSLYEIEIQSRSLFHYIIGLLVRWKLNIKYSIARKIARKKGANIGIGVVMPIKLAKRLNNKVTIGNHVSIDTSNFSSFRYPITIGNNVIIGNNVKFVMGSHRLDSPEWERYRPNDGLVIEDYVWFCPDSIILPSVKRIGFGAVIGANAVIAKDVLPMAIMTGNPAKQIKERKIVHSNLVVESLLGGDYNIYKKTWFNRKK